MSPDGAGHAGSLVEAGSSWAGWSAFVDALLLRGGYNTSVVVLGTALLGVAGGVVGAFALLRKRSMMSDALSHATLPGIGLAFLAAGGLGVQGRSIGVLLLGAAASGIVGVLAVQWILRSSRLREDAAIGAVLSVFFGAGVVILSIIQRHAPSGAGGIDAFIYGQTAAMRVSDAAMMGGIAIAACVLSALLFKELALVCFNDAFARVDGWAVSWIDLMLMGLVVLVTVGGLQAVGLILVIAMLIVPAAAARFWSDRLGVLVVLSGVIGGLSGWLGSGVSSALPRKPAGAVIVLVCGGVFALSMLAAPRRGVIADLVRRWRVRLRVAGDHVLEAAYERGESAALTRAELSALGDTRGTSRWFRWAVRAWLRRGGLVTLGGGGGLELTQAGLARGRTVARNHALWTQYLISFADVAPTHVDWAVDRVEHVLDAEMVDRLERLLNERGVLVPDPVSGVPGGAG